MWEFLLVVFFWTTTESVIYRADSLEACEDTRVITILETAERDALEFYAGQCHQAWPEIG